MDLIRIKNDISPYSYHAEIADNKRIFHTGYWKTRFQHMEGCIDRCNIFLKNRNFDRNKR